MIDHVSKFNSNKEHGIKNCFMWQDLTFHYK